MNEKKVLNACVYNWLSVYPTSKPLFTLAGALRVGPDDLRG